MRIRYDKEADAIYIRFQETPIEDTDEISSDLSDSRKGHRLIGGA
jgi:uncharacterized protein YuzE